MVDNHLSKKQIKELSDALDRVVKDLPWSQSIFLSAMGKKFEKIRNEFNSNVGIKNPDLENDSHLSNTNILTNEQIEIYISVYNLQGGELGHWARIIGNLTSQSVSRPTYLKESDVKEMIRSKLNLNNEGYVSVHIIKSDLMNVVKERLPEDKLGKKLILLKERVINESKIKQFHHDSGIYDYKKGILSKVDNMNFAEE